LLSEFVNNQKPDIIVSSRDDLYPALGEAPIATENGTLVYVRNVLHSDNINRPEIYELVNGNWEFRWKSKGTIKLSEELWNHSKFGHGFDVSPFDISGYDSEHSNIIMKVFDVLRNKIFVRNYKSFYNKLWFKCLYHAVTDNTTDDFAFKTTYTKLRVEHPLNTSRKTYQEYGIEAVEEFFNDIKPFHTKLHSSTEALTHLEENDITVSEVSVLPTIITDFKNFNGRLWAAGEILSGGTFTTVTQNIDVFEFTTSENDLEDIYDGNVFIQPVQEGWGSELYPVDFTENVRIRVQTNTSGSTVTSNTRTFQLDYFAPYNIEESTVIVDAAKTTLSSNINALVTTIPVVNATLLSDPGVGTIRGVVWINNERIEYGAVSGNNLLDCKRGTRGTSAVIHASGSTVTDASWKYRIPTPANFAHYGDDIRMAYNDTGISLSTAGISPEHNFIRNAGQGLL
jgi:hypothetical protein